MPGHVSDLVSKWRRLLLLLECPCPDTKGRAMRAETRQRHAAPATDPAIRSVKHGVNAMASVARDSQKFKAAEEGASVLCRHLPKCHFVVQEHRIIERPVPAHPTCIARKTNLPPQCVSSRQSCVYVDHLIKSQIDTLACVSASEHLSARLSPATPARRSTPAPNNRRKIRRITKVPSAKRHLQGSLRTRHSGTPPGSRRGRPAARRHLHDITSLSDAGKWWRVCCTTQGAGD